jgi:hypothetical protein
VMTYPRAEAAGGRKGRGVLGTGWQRSLWGFGCSGLSERKWVRWQGSNFGYLQVGWSVE